jgi:hypothetical protein
MWRLGVGTKITLRLIYLQATLAQDSLDRDSTQFRSRFHLLHPYVILSYMSIGYAIRLWVLTENRGSIIALSTKLSSAEV